MSNPRLDNLQPYPFERLNQLLEGVKPADQPFISLALGEPKHPAAEFLLNAYREPGVIESGFAAYPPTKGLPELRSAIADFVTRRYCPDRPVNPETEVLPVNGSREGLFAIAQALINPLSSGKTLMPNPFYQIYEGAALLAGTKPLFMNCTEDNDFLPDFDAIEVSDLAQCEIMYLCTPGNPSGAVMPIEMLQKAIELAHQYDFVVVSDECYSEIYNNEAEPPPGLLQAAAQMGNHKFERCITFNSLSKRSNLPGLRSGYVAGDAELIARFLHYRTYHGSAMSVHNQKLSAIAWADEAHVIANRELYREKYQQFESVLGAHWPMTVPTASFYLWPEVPEQFADDQAFTVELIKATNIKVLPGSFLSRTTPGDVNPGINRVRMALVATLDECLEAAHRIRDFLTAG